MQNLIAQGAQEFGCDDKDDLGELAGEHHGWFLDGIRFPSPLTMPSLVAFEPKGVNAPEDMQLSEYGQRLLVLGGTTPKS